MDWLQLIAASGGEYIPKRFKVFMVIACPSWWGTQSPVLVANTNAKDMYWIGGSGEWNDAEHWLTKSGGKTAHKVPGKSENAIFDDNSGSGTVRLEVAVHRLFRE